MHRDYSCLLSTGTIVVKAVANEEATQEEHRGARTLRFRRRHHRYENVQSCSLPEPSEGICYICGGSLSPSRTHASVGFFAIYCFAEVLSHTVQYRILPGALRHMLDLLNLPGSAFHL